MLSRILLRIASTRFWYLLLFYLVALIFIIGVGATIMGVARNLESGSATAPRSVNSLFVESAANTLGLSSIDVTGYVQLSTYIALIQGFVGILVNGVFVALVVFRAIRINHGALIFARHVLLSQQADGKWRIEFRIGNGSNYDIANVVIRVQLVEYLDSFPRTTAHKTSKVVLNYDEYLILTAHGYLLVSSSFNTPVNAAERIATIDESLLSRRFFLRVLVQGQFVRSGLSFLQFHIYDGSEVHKGHWRYYLKEDLVRRGRFLVEEFSAFDVEHNLGRGTGNSSASSQVRPARKKKT